MVIITLFTGITEPSGTALIRTEQTSIIFVKNIIEFAAIEYIIPSKYLWQECSGFIDLLFGDHFAFEVVFEKILQAVEYSSGELSTPAFHIRVNSGRAGIVQFMVRIFIRVCEE